MPQTRKRTESLARGKWTLHCRTISTLSFLYTNSSTRTSRDPDWDHSIKGLLYYIAEEEAKKKAYVHRGTSCDSCNTNPIRGVRWHCINCPDYDLCSTCETQGVHPKTHVFAKIKVPIPALRQPHHVHEPWYPGDSDARCGPLKMSLIRRFVQETGFDDIQIESLYDQFSCLANKHLENVRTRWRNGPDCLLCNN